MATKATTLDKVITNCGYFPLSTEDLAKFYVNTDSARGINLLQELSTIFKAIPNMYPQVLCLGHRGAGKSTMFYQFAQEVDSYYEIVSFSIQDTFDMEKISFTDLLCLIYKTLLEQYKSRLADSDMLRQVYELWYSTQSEETTQSRTTDLTIGAQGECGLSTRLLKLISQISSTLNFSSDSRTIVTRNIQRHIVDYIDSLNQLIESLEKVLLKPILLIIDDLDKISMTSTKDIFIEHSGYFRRIHLRLVLTAPIWLKYMPEYSSAYTANFTKVVRYPMIAVIDSEYKVLSEGFHTLEKIVEARIDKLLITDKALELAIFMSGGQIRDLLELISGAALYCLSYSSNDHIDDLAIRKAFQNLQEAFEDRLRKSDTDILLQIVNNPMELLDTEYDKLYNLMYGGAILEYNGKQWRGVHPAALACLVKSGIITTDKFKKCAHFEL